MSDTFKLRTFTRLLGALLGCLFMLGEFLGGIKIKGKRFPRKARKLIVVSNHPSMLEPFLLTYLFFPDYVIDPVNHAPLNLPDDKNFYSKWLFWPLRPVTIPVFRGQAAVGMVYRKMKEAIAGGKNLIIFPEGGRTSTGNAQMVSRTGKKLRRFKEGAAKLACETKTKVILIWVEGTDKVLPRGKWLPNILKGITIKIGETVDPGANSVEEFNALLEEKMLALADE